MVPNESVIQLVRIVVMRNGAMMTKIKRRKRRKSMEMEMVQRRLKPPNRLKVAMIRRETILLPVIVVMMMI
jgi:hypothetical protein